MKKYYLRRMFLMPTKTFNAVFKPIKIGPLTSKNRIEVSPAEPFLCTRDGLVTDEFVAFTAAMARGGAGIVTVGDSPVNQAYADENHFVVNLADKYVTHGLVKVTDAIHRYGALASIELNLRDERKPEELSIEDIKGIINDFAVSAERCKKAGFDMVLLHFGHGHTLATFYSPHVNKRTDDYGTQTFENRCRFANELIDAVREKIGPNMAIEVRMSGDELYPEGVHVEDAILFAREIAKKIDMIHISAGSMYDPRTMGATIQHTYMPRATNLYLAAQFKAANLGIPVTSVGSFDMELAEQAVAEGKADVIAMIRAFIADPEHVNKAKQGRAQDIRPCLRCNACTGDDPHGCPKPLRCSVNPVQGRHPLFDKIEKAEVSKKVVIIGGGCAGMEAARRLVERGHRPVIIEKDAQLGGSLILAGANIIKGDVKRYADWSVDMTLRTKGIDIRLGTEATRELVSAEKPDALIVAVGSSQIKPDVPGINGDNVCFAVDVDMGKVKPGKKVVLVGAGLTGSETALTLAREGHQVTVIDMLSLREIMTRDKNIRNVHELCRREGVSFMEIVRLCAVTDKGIEAEDKNGKKLSLDCDTVVISLGVRPRTEVMEQFNGICEETCFVGDCNNRQGNINSAVREGFYAAMNI
jgi:2,4-dienoyl-CoA reductase-like NADH-dependent reductase (Old Yellow Enzyme family)/thioredoxin reductase